jgi:hypothetical protein
MIACGKSSNTSSDGTVFLECADASTDEVCDEAFNLAPGTYSWKVVGTDGNGGTTESKVRTFTVE